MDTNTAPATTISPRSHAGLAHLPWRRRERDGAGAMESHRSALEEHGLQDSNQASS